MRWKGVGWKVGMGLGLPVGMGVVGEAGGGAGGAVPPGGENQDQGYDEDEDEQECCQPCDDANQLCLPGGLCHLPGALVQSRGEGTALASGPPSQPHMLLVPSRCAPCPAPLTMMARPRFTSSARTSGLDCMSLPRKAKA